MTRDYSNVWSLSTLNVLGSTRRRDQESPAPPYCEANALTTRLARPVKKYNLSNETSQESQGNMVLGDIYTTVIFVMKRKIFPF